jgi:hypothetical protein
LFLTPDFFLAQNQINLLNGIHSSSKAKHSSVAT